MLTHFTSMEICTSYIFYRNCGRRLGFFRLSPANIVRVIEALSLLIIGSVCSRLLSCWSAQQRQELRRRKRKILTSHGWVMALSIPISAVQARNHGQTNAVRTGDFLAAKRFRAFCQGNHIPLIWRITGLQLRQRKYVQRQTFFQPYSIRTLALRT